MDTVEVKPLLAPELLESIAAKVMEEKQVIVHCCFASDFQFGNLIRIWRSTYLIDRESGHRSALVHAENITFFPFWTEVPAVKDYWFTLVFTGLPSDCKNFDLKEEIPQEGGFYVQNIARNNSDIYRIKIS